jgi:hypothetical protein
LRAFRLPAPKLAWRATDFALERFHKVGRILEAETFTNQSNRQGRMSEEGERAVMYMCTSKPVQCAM